MKENIYDMRESSTSFYGLPEFIERTKEENEKGTVGLVPGIYTTDVDFEEMSEEKGDVSRFIKNLTGKNRNRSVRNLTIYTALMLQYIGGMLRKYLNGKTLTGLLKSELAESMNNCEMTYEILRTIDDGEDGRGYMDVVR